MPIIGTLGRRVYLALADLTWAGILSVVAFHVATTWILLSWAGEEGLTGDARGFLYFYVTTASTVGYGDMSPSGHAGRTVAALWLLPGAVAVFTMVLGKVATSVGGLWRKRMDGAGSYASRTGHTVVMGWQGARTRRLIEQMVEDAIDGVRPVLVGKSIAKNPMPDEIDFVAVDALSVPDGHVRAGTAGARTVIVRGEDDDETLAATLAAVAEAPGAHVVAHFEDDRARDLILRQCPSVEAVSSLSTEILVRASRDPGASRVADLLFDAASDDTVYSVRVPDDVAPGVAYVDALLRLKTRHAMTLIGRGDGSRRGTDLNCADGTVLTPGTVLFYIADDRVEPSSIDWGDLSRPVEPTAGNAR